MRVRQPAKVMSLTASPDMMALWVASGGAVDALGDGDGAKALSRQPHGLVGNDGLEANRFTTHPFSCAEDGIEAARVTKGYACIPPSADDGLRADGASLSCAGLS